MRSMVKDFQTKHDRPVDLRLNDQNDRDVSMSLLQASVVVKALSSWMETAYIDAKCEDCRVIRAHLMLEELAEVLLALGTNQEVDLLDGLCDLVYVVLGAANTFDLPFEDAFAEVHRSNMTKGVHANDPRVRQKDTYDPPKLASILAEYRR